MATKNKDVNSDVDVATEEEGEGNFHIGDWEYKEGEKQETPTNEGDDSPSSKSEEEESQEDILAKGKAAVDKLKLESGEEGKTPKTPKSPKEEIKVDPSDLISKIVGDDDTDFTLDDETKDDTDPEKDPEHKKVVVTNDDVVALIAKEFDIDDAPSVEQLVSSLRQKLYAAEAGSSGSVAVIDRFLKLENRELYKELLMRQKHMSAEDAEKFISDGEEMHGEKWVDHQVMPIRLEMQSSRSEEMQKAVNTRLESEKKKAQFGVQVKEAVHGLKTILGIPLKDYIPQLKEFQAQLSNEEWVTKMRNDPQAFTEAMFLLTHGKTVLNGFLKSKGDEIYGDGWEESFKSNVEKRILNKSKPDTRNQSPMHGSKDGTFNINDWEGSSEQK